jgi:hypothetical protein
MVDQPNIKVLTPCFMGKVESGYLHSLLNLFPYAMENGMPFTVETLPNCSLISLGRSIMLNRALTHDKNFTHVLWIDADLRFRPEYIHSMVLEDKDIVGGFYPKKGLPIDFASSPAPDGEDTENLFETIYVATGFMMVKRAVIEAMVEHYREELKFFYQGTDDAVHLFHPIIDRENQDLFLTEDYAFCKRAREIGFRCFMSKRFELPHIGVMEYSAEGEMQFLQEYEKRGRIKILKEAGAEDYFSALRPPEEESPPEFNQTQPLL